MARLKLAILISGRGSNMQALIEACAQDDFPAQVAVVISNRPNAQGLQKAAAAGIDTVIVDHKDYAGRDAFEHALDKALRRYAPDIICLAGFMRLISAGLIGGWEGRIVNIHPSLLPAYKGLDTHRRVLQDKKTQTGCTVHYVVPEMDSGPVILQRTVDVLPDDTPETLSARVLEQEHIAYPAAIRLIATDRVKS
jgi:phosphoribosylglycinamide formyltransferase-1